LLANAFFWRKKIPSHVEMGTKNGGFGKKNTQLYFTTKCGGKKIIQKQNLTKLN